MLMHEGGTVDLGQVNDCLTRSGPLADIIGRSSKEVDLSSPATPTRRTTA